MGSPPICPECVAGKHRNCDGTAWDIATDEPTRCQCDVCNPPLQQLDHYERTCTCPARSPIQAPEKTDD